jgi:Tfp pilus assembly protein PilF
MTTSARRFISFAAKGLSIAVVGALAVAACGSSSHSAAPPTTSPANAGTVLTKALQELVAGQTAQAKADFEQVLRLDPRNKYAEYNLGYIAQIGGNASDAETQYRLALAIDPKYGPALYNLAILRTADGATAAAIELYRRAIAADAKDANAHFNLGLLLRKTGNANDGNAEITTAVGLKPSLAAAAAAQGDPGLGT